MRNALLMSAGLLCLAAAPALAQNATITTQTPPSPNAQSFTPSPGVSVPGGSATATTPRAGDDVSTTQTGPRGRAMPVARQPGAAAMDGNDRGMTGMRPMRGQGNHAVDPSDTPYQGGESAPMSRRASNTGARSTRSEIAPRLPDPNVDSNSPEAFLGAAERAVRARQSGRAQEALERAETRLLNRSVEAGMIGSPPDNPAVQHIGEARRALGRGDFASARQLIQAAQSTAGTGAGMGMSSGQTGGMGMGQGQGMSGGQMGGMGHSHGMGMSGQGNVGTQGQSTGAQGVGAPVSGMAR